MWIAPAWLSGSLVQGVYSCPEWQWAYSTGKWIHSPLRWSHQDKELLPAHPGRFQAAWGTRRVKIHIKRAWRQTKWLRSWGLGSKQLKVIPERVGFLRYSRPKGGHSDLGTLKKALSRWTMRKKQHGGMGRDQTRQEEEDLYMLVFMFVTLGQGLGQGPDINPILEVSINPGSWFGGIQVHFHWSQDLGQMTFNPEEKRRRLGLKEF